MSSTSQARLQKFQLPAGRILLSVALDEHRLNVEDENSSATMYSLPRIGRRHVRERLVLRLVRTKPLQVRPARPTSFDTPIEPATSATAITRNSSTGKSSFVAMIPWVRLGRGPSQNCRLVAQFAVVCVVT